MEKQEITVYCGIRLGAVGEDVHGGYGEVWGRDFSIAKRFAQPPTGYMFWKRDFRLHPTAKQLVLVTEEDEEGYSDYVEDGIQQLAKIVGWEWLFENLMSGHQLLWEVWEPEWTELIIKAGYDSIFKSGFDGPEEYILKPNKLQFVYYHRILEDGKTKAYRIKLDTLDLLNYKITGTLN